MKCSLPPKSLQINILVRKDKNVEKYFMKANKRRKATKGELDTWCNFVYNEIRHKENKVWKSFFRFSFRFRSATSFPE